MTIYEFVKVLADEKNMTIAEVERACGLGNATVKAWAKSSPRVDKLYIVSEFFNVPMEYFLTGNRKPWVCDEMENELLKAFRGSTASGKARIIQVCMNEYDQSTVAQAI